MDTPVHLLVDFRRHLLDILVELEAGRSLLDRIALIQDLEDLLGIEVDVVTERSVHRDLRDEILRSAQPL